MSAPAPEQKTVLRKVIASDGRTRRGKRAGSAWPYCSDALGVNPDQIKETQAELAKHGLNCEFTPDGQAIIQSQKHFDAIATVSGLRTGRDGYEVRNDRGQKIHTGRSAAREREHLKAELARGNWQAVEQHFGLNPEEYC